MVIAVRRGLPDGDEPVGVQEGQRPEQHVVDEAVDRGVRADAECDGEDRDEGEAGGPEERTNRLPDVEKEGVHPRSLGEGDGGG